jgi:hypothetical protein
MDKMGRYMLAVMVAAVMFGVNAFAADQAAPEAKKHESKTPEQIFQKMDTNSDGKVSKDEYVTAMEERAKKSGHEMTKEAIEKRFTKLDTNADGFLTIEELKAGHQHHEKPAAAQPNQ